MIETLTSTVFGGGIVTRLCMYGMLALCCFGAGAVWEGERQVDKATEREGAKASAVAKIVTQQGATTVKWATKVVREQVLVKESEDEIQRRVADYVSAHADSVCPVPLGFMRHWNRANGAVPDAASGDNEDAAAVTLSGIAAEHAAESELHRLKEIELDACQGWVREQYKAMNGIELELGDAAR